MNDILTHFLVPSLPIADVMFAFRESTWPGRIIVILLFIGSIYAWSIMVTKFMSLKRAKLESQRFLTAYRREQSPVGLFLKRQKFPESPLYEVYQNGCASLGAEIEAAGANPSELFMGGMGSGQPRISQMQMHAVRNSADRNVADQALVLESNMGVLATAVSASPFLGLLGTVWGVMDAFGGMAVTGSATLSSVAPGIAGALMTTVVGLLVALPSSIGYNMLASRIRVLTVQLDNFAQEFEAEVQRHFAKE